MRARCLAIASLVLTATQTLGCWAIHNREGDLDRSPVVNTGAGASIIYPGQSAPMHPGNYHPREAGYNQGVVANPNATTQSRSGPGPSSGSATSGYVPPGAVGSQIAVSKSAYLVGGRSSNVQNSTHALPSVPKSHTGRCAALRAASEDSYRAKPADGRRRTCRENDRRARGFRIVDRARRRLRAAPGHSSNERRNSHEQ